MSSAGRLLAVDIGNSSTKLGLYEVDGKVDGQVDGKVDGEARDDNRLPRPSTVFSEWTELLPSPQLSHHLPSDPLAWFVASVQREASQRLQAWVAEHRPGDQFHLLTYRDLPLRVDADYPERVGLDRLAAAVAASFVCNRSQPAIIVDAGTAVTVDLLDRDHAFQGGAILPGHRLQAEALFGRTDQLPLVELAANDAMPPALGKHTEAAIRSGLFWGSVGAVRELIAQLSRELDVPPAILVTGGDLQRLAQAIGPPAVFVPDLVLAGIALAGLSLLGRSQSG